MNTKLIYTAFPLVILIVFALSYLSCSKDVTLDNPLDPNVQISAPSGLKIILMKETTLQLAWDNNLKDLNDDQGNKITTIIEQSNDGTSFSPVDTVTGNKLTTTITEQFITGNTYYFRICTFAGSRNGLCSNVVSGQENSSYAPSNLSAGTVSETQRVLTWQDNSTSETGFIIERKLGENGNYGIIGQVPANTTTFTDTAIILTDTTYYYEVCASFSKSTYSTYDTLSVNLPFPQPDSLKVTSLSASSVKLTWNDNSEIEDGFIIEKHERGAEYTQLTKVASNTTSFIDNQVDQSKDYFYHVKAYTKYNQSKYSNEIKIGYFPGNSSEKYISNLYFWGNCPIVTSADGKYSFFGGHFVNDQDGNNYGHFYIINNFDYGNSKGGYHGTNLLCAAFSNDDKYFATLSNEGNLKIWNCSSLVVNNSISCTLQLNHIIFSSDNTKLICTASDNRIYCWNINDGILLYITNAYLQTISNFELSPDGETIACVSGNQVDLINPYTGNVVYSYPSFSSIVNRIAFSSNNLFAVMSGGNRIDIWDNAKRILKYTITGFSTWRYEICFTDDNNYLVAFCRSDSIYNLFYTWRLSDCQLVRTWQSYSAPDLIFPGRGSNKIFEFMGGNEQALLYWQINYGWDLLNN